MKSVNSVLLNEIRTAYNLYAVPRLIVDWNWNRYVQPKADNTPSEDDAGFDIEAFPIESIYDPIRPTKGIAKALVNQATVATTYNQPTDPKFYIGDVDDTYKYWNSPNVTNASGVFPLHTDGQTTARPYITYPKQVLSNKIVIKIENTWASPNNYNVLVQSTVGGSWVAVGGNSPTIDNATGVITLYYNGTAWVTSRPATLVATQIAGIQLKVVSMKNGYKRDGSVMTYRAPRTNTVTNTNGASSSLQLISIEAHYEADLSDRLINVSDDFEMSNESELYPIGTVTSNQGTVSLSNDDGIFNPDNTSSPYYGLIDANAEFNLEYVYKIGATSYSVQEFKLYSDIWSIGSDGTVSVNLTDYSKFLDNIKPGKIMYQNKTVNEIIWRILDSIGFVDYEIQQEDTVVENVIPVFWTTGDDTVWAVLNTLSEASQTAIYFDGFGKLQVRTRQAAFRDTATADWHLLGVPDGASLPDLVTVSPGGEYQANSIDVTYKTTKWKTGTTGAPATDQVWSPTEDTVVRSAPLLTSLSATGTLLNLDQKEVKVWPYKSKVQVDGEIIQYEGKQYVYYTGATGTVKNVAIVKDADDLATYNAKTPADYRGKNYFTGGLQITERAVWNTNAIAHPVDSVGWTPKMEINVVSGHTGVAMQSSNPRGFTLDKGKSTASINTPAQMSDSNSIFWSAYGTSASTKYLEYGTRIKFNNDKAATTQRAGIGIVLSGAEEKGYYIEFTPTAKLNATARKTRNEVTIFSRTGPASWTVLSKGAPVALAVGIWYDVDVDISSSGGQDTITVWLNGQNIASGKTTAATHQTDSGRMAMYARGRTNVSYEYMYGISSNYTVSPNDNFGFYDLEYGGVRGDYWQREHVWTTTTRYKKIKKKKQKKIQIQKSIYMFDEFGPYVHEVREFDVKFDPAPVNYSYLFNNNDSSSTLIEYTGNPFGAKFIIANTSRQYAVLQGAAPVYGSTATVNMILTVLGQDLIIQDDAKITVTNPDSIRKHGVIQSELTSDWIQSKGMAQTLADWMNAHWSAGVDELQVDIFGNPLIEVCDVVDINYPDMAMTPTTHKYFVTSVSNSFDSGLTTTLNLRRIV